jgi:ABC-2 type transport system ATP-binding protein
MNPLRIEIQNIHFRYTQSKDPREVLTELSLATQPGQLFGLIGPNGVGKSTLIKVALGVFVPQIGQVWYETPQGRIQPDLNQSQFKQCLGYVSGASSKLLQTLTLNEHIALYSTLYPRFLDQAFKARLKRFKIETKLDRYASALSFGERIKFEIALTLATAPLFLFLDEPSVGLDPNAIVEVRDELKDYLQETGATGILTSHNLTDITEVCTSGALLHDGTLKETFISSEVSAQTLERRFREIYR